MLGTRSASVHRLFAGPTTDFIKRLTEKYEYVRADGTFRHKSAARRGQVAGSIGTGGYRKVLFENKLWVAARLVWIIEHKEWPPVLIGYHDGDPGNTQIDNLFERKTKRQLEAEAQDEVARVFNDLEELARRDGAKGLPWYLSNLRDHELESFT